MRALLLMALVMLAAGEASAQCGADHSSCPQAAETGTELCPSDLAPILTQAARNELGSGAPAYRQIDNGCNNPEPVTQVTATVPCVLVEAIAETESDWQQFCATCSAAGSTLISFDCGYGILQITSGMDGSGGFSPSQVAGNSAYDVGTGVTILLDKWAATPCVGDNRPEVAEDWYLAVWAYNGFAWVNNPNNPNFPASRPPFRSPGSLSAGSYPYQEIVWGYAAHPPQDNGADRYPALALTLPDPSTICNTDGCDPGNIPDPSPFHCDECQRGNAVTLVSLSPSDPLSLAPGEMGSFSLTLQNSGTSAWTTAGYALIQLDGGAIGPGSIALPGEVAAGATVEVAIPVTAPASGTASATYQLFESPCAFGATFAVKVHVIASSASSSASSTSSGSTAGSSSGGHSSASSSSSTASGTSSSGGPTSSSGTSSSGGTRMDGDAGSSNSTGARTGCGCASGGSLGWVWLPGLVAAANRRRRMAGRSIVR